MDEFLRTRPLSWWRGYYKNSVQVAEQILKRPLTPVERRQFAHKMAKKARGNDLCSSGTIATMYIVYFRRELFDHWEAF